MVFSKKLKTLNKAARMKFTKGRHKKKSVKKLGFFDNFFCRFIFMTPLRGGVKENLRKEKIPKVYIKKKIY